MFEFHLSSCQRLFSIHCSDRDVAALVSAVFGAMQVPAAAEAEVDCRYVVERRVEGGFRVGASDGRTALPDDTDDLVYFLDKELTIALQYQRPDLFFVHAGVVALDHRAIMVSAPSGTGKSTLTLVLLESGFNYLSDELAPIDVPRRLVHPYPHALCLKSLPPPPYRLPAGTIETGERFHVPVEALPVMTQRAPLELSTLLFLRRVPGGGGACTPITAADAAARLMENALNPLAHPASGLDAAIALARALPCYLLEMSELKVACDAVGSLLHCRAGAGDRSAIR